MSEKIKVAIKVRPLIERERCKGAQEQWTVSNNSMYLTNIKTRDKDCYYFDYVFDQEKTNSDLFEAVIKPIVDAAVRGFNGTVFAYGQTSSGKTYTMMGTQLEPGIIPQTINYIFQAIRSITSLEGRNFLLRASYMEIYNERVVDLLEGEERPKLQEIDGQVVICKLKEEVACTAEKILSLMKRGEKIRKTSQTNMNERSSRSHTIFRIIIESGLQDEEENGAVQVSHLNLVDLAGSERVDQTGAVGERLKEGCSINRSLFMLGHVISQLSEGQEHVSFRDSKLTRILQSSLGGNAHTAIICTVTPAVIDETISTLGFASRAANINNKPLKNEVLTDAALLRRYARQIAKLQEELKKTKHSNKASEEIESKLEETRRHNQLLQQRIDLLQEKLIGFPVLDSNASDVRRALRRRTWGGHTTKPRFSVYAPQTLNPIEEESECLEQERGEVFSRSVADFQYGDFETPLEEFELELIEAERNRYSSESLSSNEESLVTIRKKGKTISFGDQSESKDVVFAENGKFPSESECLYCNKCNTERTTSKEVDCQTDDCHSDSTEAAVNTSLELTSCDNCCKQCNESETTVMPRTDMKDANCQTEAAVYVRLSDQFAAMETPPKQLRERAKYYQKEYDELLEFTRLEKQLICEEQLSALLRENNELRIENEEVKKSVAELETMYLDANRSLSFIQDENKHLKQRLEDEVKQCSELSRNISALNETQEKTNTKIKDILALEKEMKALKQKLQKLENEKLDFEYTQQLQEEKYQRRISELSKSLEEAWKHSETVNKVEKDADSCERCMCLMKELQAYKAQPISKVNVGTSEPSMQEMQTAQKQESEYDYLLEKEKALDVLNRKLSEAENKILELSNFVDLHANCSSVLQEKDTAFMSVQEQLADKEKLTHCSEETIRLMQEELSKAKIEIMELVEVREMNAACIETLKKEEESHVALQNEWKERYSEVNVILKEKEETIMLLQERLREAENNLEEVRELTEDYSVCVKELKEKQETVFILQAQLSSNETVLKEMKEKLIILTDDLKEKERKISVLEEKLITTENEMQNIHISYAEVLKEKDESFLSITQQLAEREQHLEESKATCLKLAENLKENDVGTALLQRDLIQAQNEINEAAKVKQLREECECTIKENQQTILLLQEQLTNSEKSIVEMTQKYSETVDALRKSQDDCTLLQEKLNNAENELKALVELKAKHAALMHELEQKEEVHVSIQEQLTNYQISLSEMEQNNALLIQSVKEKENALTLLQNKLSLVEHSPKETAEIKEIHAMCTVALNEKEESLLSYKQKLADNEIFIAETTEEMSKLSQACAEKEERIISLEKQLHEAETRDLLQKKPLDCETELEENRSAHVDTLKEIELERTAVIGNKLCEGENNEREIVCTALNEKDEYISSLEESFAAHKILLEKITKECSTLTDTLREKEETITVLQLKLHKSSLEVEEGKELKHIHSECLLNLKEKEELLLYLEEKLAANEIFTVEVMQNCSKLTKAFTDIEERICELEQKVFALLEKRLQDSQSELDKGGMHSHCIESLREKDELLSLLERQIIANEISAAETIQNCSRLAGALRGIEDSINALEEKLYEAENCEKQMERKLSTYVAALKEKEEMIAFLEEELHESQSKIEGKEIHSQCIQSLREKDELLSNLETKVTANEIAATEIIQNCSKLAGALRGLDECVNALEQKLCKAEHCEIEMDLEIQTLKEQCSNMTNEIVLFNEMKEVHAKCSDILKEKEELVSSLKEKLTNSNKRSATLEEKLVNILREKEESLVLLQETKSEMEKEIMEVERLKEVNEINTEALKQKTEDILTLEQKLSDKEVFVKELEEVQISMANALKNKETAFILLQEELHNTKKEMIEAASLKEIHAKCVNILMEKEELVSSLQEKLTNNNKHSATLKENLVKISREKEESLVLVQETKNEIEKKIMEVERLKEVNEINTQALKQKTEDVLTLEQKLSDKEVFVKKLEETQINMANVLKNKEAALVLLQEELHNAKKEIIELTTLKEIHLKCTEAEKERELTILLLKEKIADFEVRVKQLQENHAILTSNRKEKEEVITSLKEKFRATENETLGGKFLCVKCSKENENYPPVQEQLTCQEAEAEIQENASQEALNKESLQIDDVFIMDLEEDNVMPLTDNSSNNKRSVNLQHEGSWKTEDDEVQIIKVCDTSIKVQEVALPLADQFAHEETLSVEIEENYSAIMMKLKESVWTVNLLQENIDNFTKDAGSAQLNMVCVECSKIKETDEILNALKQKITCCEKEISEHKIKLTALVTQLSYTAKLLNEKENCLKAAEHRLNIAENKLTVLRAELATTSSESGSSLGATPPVQRHFASEHDLTIVPDVLKLELDALIKENQTLRDERNNYQCLYEGERERLQELANLYKEELEEIQVSSSHASQSFTQNHPANTTCEVELSYVSEKMLKEIENRKCNSFDSEAICNSFSKSSSCSKTELETQRNENTTLLKTCKEFDDTVKKYETSLKQLRSENVNLTSQLQDKTQELYSLRKAMVNEISSLNPKLKPELKEYCLQKLLSTLLSSIMEKQNELYEEMEGRISYLNNKISEREKQQLDSDKRKDSWTKHLESEVEQLTKQLDALDSRKDLVKQQESNDMVTKLKEEKQELLKKVQYLEQDVKSFQHQMNAEAETEKLKHEDLICKIDRLESRVLSKDKIIRKLEEEIETKNWKEHQLLVKFENEIKKSNTLECNLKAMERKLKDLEQVKLTLLQELECKCKEGSEQSDILNSECERNKILDSQIIQLQTHLENISRKNESLTRQKVKLEQNLEEEQQKNTTLLSKMEVMEQELDCLKQEVISKDVAFKQEKLALEEEQQKNNMLLSKMEVMEQEVDHIKQEVISKDVAFKQEKRALEEEQQKNNMLLLKMEVMEQEIDCLKQEVISKDVAFKQEKRALEEEQQKNNLLLSKMEVMEQEVDRLKQEVISKDVAFKQEKRALEEEQQKSTSLLSKMEVMEQKLECLKQEAISKDVAFEQEKLALEEEQQKTSTLLLKIGVMEEEMNRLHQLEISRDIDFKQEKRQFQKEIQKLEYSAKVHKAESAESMKQKDTIIKQLEQEIEIKQHMLEKETKTVSELQLHLKNLEKKASDLVSKNSALVEEVKHRSEVEQKLKHKLNMEMQKVQALGNHLAQITAEKEDKIQRNEELIKKNMRLELQHELLQKKETQLWSVLDIVQKEFYTLKEEVMDRKATMVKVYTVGQPCETRQQTNCDKNSIDLLPFGQQEFICDFQEGIREIKEYLTQTDTYWEELENIRRENNALYEEHEACKAALEAEKCKAVQLKDVSKEYASSSEEKQMSEASKEAATRLERTVHQLCKTEKEREHYKKSLKHEQEERRSMAQELEQLKSNLESCRMKNNVLYNHARDLQLRMQELRDTNEHLELENSGAAHRIAQLQDEIQRLRDSKAAAEEKCQCKTLTQEINQLRSKVSEQAAWEQRFKAERIQCHKFEKDVKLYKDKVSELKAELQKIRDSEQNVRKSHLNDAGAQADELKPCKGASGVPYEDLMREYKLQEKKIEKYKQLCRYRMQKITNLEHTVQQLEDSISSRPSGLQSTDKMADKENHEDVASNR